MHVYDWFIKAISCKQLHAACCSRKDWVRLNQTSKPAGQKTKTASWKALKPSTEVMGNARMPVYFWVEKVMQLTANLKYVIVQI